MRLSMDQDTKEVAQLHAQMGVLHRAMSQDDLAQSHLKRFVVLNLDAHFYGPE